MRTGLQDFQTMWFGGRRRQGMKDHAVHTMFGRQQASHSSPVLTVWGWLETAPTYGKRQLPQVKKDRSKTQVVQLFAFNTIWFGRSNGKHPYIGRTKGFSPMTHCRSVWGDLPMWDGRMANGFPDVRENRKVAERVLHFA